MSRISGPTLINLPPPPSDPGGATPSDFGPGTPNSGFSTAAIKDGHQGTVHTHARGHTTSSASDSSTNTLDAERADRISRLAGLERVAALRGASQHLPQALQQQQQPPSYFDNAGGLHKSTVGSASATGSAGGRNTWASGSDIGDRMSEDQDDGHSSAGMSDEGNASLVGFGEGAGSTVSGPTSTSTKWKEAAGTGVGSPTSGRQQKKEGGSPMEGVEN
ncbi:hypothetical protein ABVK25_003341 [Lepraria finkii]|uniref:Uncharacterized protein n=1 Tax=Lepraria finkii TaxID=1340010 RepID=A0ABR4BK52_9LECA